MATLCHLTGVGAPALPGSFAETKQVAALQTLLGVAVGPEAGLLGPAWIHILRLLSELDFLQVIAGEKRLVDARVQSD